MAYFDDSSMKMVAAIFVIGFHTVTALIFAFVGAVIGAPLALFQHDWTPLLTGAGIGAGIGLILPLVMKVLGR